MRIKFPSNIHLSCLALALVEVLLIASFIGERTEASPIDTLDLQVQWVFPIKVRDMKLIDFNNDGINEILVGFKSDSSRVGILDAVTQSWLWQSPAFNGTIYTVAAGDRNNDGYLDIICGGQRSDSSIGYIEIFDGPTFDSIHTASGFDQIVLAAAISTIDQDSLPQIFLGTQFDSSGSIGEGGWFAKRSGKLYALNGQDITVQSISNYGAIRDILIEDNYYTAHEKMFLGWDRWETEEYPTIEYTDLDIWIVERTPQYSHWFSLLGAGWQTANCGDGSFSAMEVGSFDGGASDCILAVGQIHTWCIYPHEKTRLSCWSELTAKLIWSIEWNTGKYITDLAICCLNSRETNAFCIAYWNGLMEFREGSTGNILAVSSQPYLIYHMKLGNVDQDSLFELCLASRDSLYVYRTEILPPKYKPLVSDIPDQTIAEGKNFSPINLDDYVNDPDDPDSVLVWSYWGETRLVVDITNRVATITPPNQDWNGAETIWFKACDPIGLCDSNQVTFTVTAVNDPPVVLNIPDQTITEGESFTSVNLDNYVTDPDNPKSAMAWSYWGQVGLLVNITNRKATITIPNPEWNGSETIWFKACDPGGLCDSVPVIFTVIAVDDAPVVSGIPAQTIAEGGSFTSINLNDYVTDPDDPDSALIWSCLGELGLIVNITDGVATINVPNPEWKGDETIWFKVCDPAGLCDSSKAVFKVLPNKFYLFQNYPNPFNPQTNIHFDVPISLDVTITIYSILGEKVREFERRYEAGACILMWDGKNSSGKDAASGIYLYRFSAGNYRATRKMVLIR